MTLVEEIHLLQSHLTSSGTAYLKFNHSSSSILLSPRRSVSSCKLAPIHVVTTPVPALTTQIGIDVAGFIEVPIMDYLLPAFKGVSLIFAVSAVATGVQAIVYPVSFSRSFGIPITAVKDADTSKSTVNSHPSEQNNDPVALSYVSLMGVRQLATGITLLTFAYQKKWTEIATILSILGIVVAGTDGYYLSRTGARSQARFHAIPGALIALLAGAVSLTNA